MKRIILLIFVTVLCLTLVTAKEVDSLQDVYNEHEQEITAVLDVDTENNEELLIAQKQAVVSILDALENQELPEIVKTLFGNERINIDLGDGYMIAAVLEDGNIVRLEDGELRYATINVKVSDEVFFDIQEKQFDLNNSLESGDISYEGVGFIRQAKLGISRTAFKVASWF